MAQHPEYNNIWIGGNGGAGNPGTNPVFGQLPSAINATSYITNQVKFEPISVGYVMSHAEMTQHTYPEEEMRRKLINLLVAELIKQNKILFSMMIDPVTFQKKGIARIFVSDKANIFTYLSNNGTNITQKP
jgi:hypothetical protein